MSAYQRMNETDEDSGAGTMPSPSSGIELSTPNHSSPSSHRTLNSSTSIPSSKKRNRLCTWRRFIFFFEIALFIIQLGTIIIDWDDHPNRPLHIWLIVSMSYRIICILFQWIAIEPCVRYLHAKKAHVKHGFTNRSCYLWVLSWLWIIENDIFLVIWTLLGTYLVIHLGLSSSNHDSLYIPIFIVVSLVLFLSYLLWLFSIAVSLGKYLCPIKTYIFFKSLGILIDKDMLALTGNFNYLRDESIHRWDQKEAAAALAAGDKRERLLKDENENENDRHGNQSKEERLSFFQKIETETVTLEKFQGWPEKEEKK